jgi:hypothetical protein
MQKLLRLREGKTAQGGDRIAEWFRISSRQTVFLASGDSIKE